MARLGGHSSFGRHSEATLSLAYVGGFTLVLFPPYSISRFSPLVSPFILSFYPLCSLSRLLSSSILPLPATPPVPDTSPNPSPRYFQNPESLSLSCIHLHPFPIPSLGTQSPFYPSTPPFSRYLTLLPIPLKLLFPRTLSPKHPSPFSHHPPPSLHPYPLPITTLPYLSPSRPPHPPPLTPLTPTHTPPPYLASRPPKYLRRLSPELKSAAGDTSADFPTTAGGGG